MNNPWILMMAFTAGVLIGLFFFGGLWWTVQKGVSSKSPSLWFLGSLIFRTSLALAGFYGIGHGHWERLLLCLCGFITARFALTRLTESARQEAARAP